MPVVEKVDPLIYLEVDNCLWWQHIGNYFL